MSRIHGLKCQVMYGPVEEETEYECFCGRIFYSEKEFRDHVNNYG